MGRTAVVCVIIDVCILRVSFASRVSVYSHHTVNIEMEATLVIYKEIKSLDHVFEELELSLAGELTDEHLLEEGQKASQPGAWEMCRCQPQQLRTCMPACHLVEGSYWLWETVQLRSDSFCLLGALKTMLWQGGMTSRVSASAYVLGIAGVGYLLMRM